MNIGIIGNTIEDIKLLLDLKSSFNNNYFYCYNKDNSNISNIINYLINNHDIDILILLDNNIDSKKIKDEYKKILVIDIKDILLNYINDFNWYKDILIVTDKTFKSNKINTFNIDTNILVKNENYIINYLNNNISNLSNKFNYIYSINTRINKLLNNTSIEAKIIESYLPIKYLLEKYSKNNIESKMVIYTTDNKENLKNEIKDKYKCSIDVRFINNKNKYLINIDKFSGPLDLLLHLIKESNIDIYDINISEIAEQYLKYIKTMESMNLLVASSYLVLSSELMYLKSSMLLPKKENEKEDEEELTREKLIERLIEYKRYKEIANDFKIMEGNGTKYLIKVPTKLDIEEKNVQSNYNIDDLVEAFNKFLERKLEDAPLNVTVTEKEYSIRDRCKSIKNILKEKHKISFSDLFVKYNKPYIIVSFLSILELLKSEEIYLIQNNIFDNIEIGIKD